MQKHPKSHLRAAPDFPMKIHAESFMNAASLIGVKFLECGGPVTRLETQLVAAGEKLGIRTTVNAIPSTISIYCHDLKEGKSYSSSGRVSSFEIDLGQLKFVDKILNQFAAGEVTPILVEYRLKRLSRAQDREALPAYGLSVFGIAAGAVLLTGASLQHSMLAAFFTLLVQLAVVALQKALRFQAVLEDFIGCFLGIFLSAIASSILKVPPQILSLGTLVYYVPGLLMTTGISEIVDQNYLAGTIRLLKAAYTFMSMALAYFLAQDLARSLEISLNSAEFVKISGIPILTQLLGSALIVFSSCIEFRAHRRSILRVMLCGMAGAVTYFFVSQYSYLVLSSFASAFVIGVVSYGISRHYKHPSQIYSMPSILILAPGMLAFSSFGYAGSVKVAATVGSSVVMNAVVHALLISLAIVFGLAAGRVPFREAPRSGSVGF